MLFQYINLPGFPTMHFPYIPTTSCRSSRGNTFEKRRFHFLFKLHFLFDEIALIYLDLFSLQPLKWVLEEEVVPD